MLDESDAARRERLARILEGARLLSHTTLQLLTLARSDEAANLRWKLEPVPLEQLVSAILADRLTAADAAGVDPGAQLQPAVIEGVQLAAARGARQSGEQPHRTHAGRWLGDGSLWPGRAG